MANWVYFLFLTFMCVLIHGCFSMFEMAAVSFNKIRLHYFVNKNVKRARWLEYLLNKPSRLFGTTLIGVNTFLQIGSEASRKFYESLHLTPDFAPITQIFIVLVFAELAPMFAARRYPEHVSMIGIPAVFLVSKILAPVIFLLDCIARVFSWMIGQKKTSSLFLSREEIQKAFEEREQSNKKDVNTIVGNIFSLKNKLAQEILLPLNLVQIVPSVTTLKELRHVLSVKYSPFILIHHNTIENVVAVVQPRDLLRARQEDKIIDYAKAPWFITEKDTILQILHQFRSNNQSVAVVLGSFGQAIGLVTLDLITDCIFGPSEKEDFESLKALRFVERTLPGSMLIVDFNIAFHADLQITSAQTLSELMTQTLDHPPAKGESIRIGEFEFTAVEPTLLGAKIISVKSLST